MNINLFLPKVKFRSSHWRCFAKKGVPKSFVNFTGKHRWWSQSFCEKGPATLLKKRLWHKCFVIFLRTPFFIEHLWWLLLQFLFLSYLILIWINSMNLHGVSSSYLKHTNHATNHWSQHIFILRKNNPHIFKYLK